MRPRSPTVRAQERQDREAAKLLSRPAASAPAATPEGEWLRAEMAKLEAEQAQIEAELTSHNGATEQNTGNHDER